MAAAASRSHSRRRNTPAGTLSVDVRTDPVADRTSLTVRGELVHGCAEALAQALAELPPDVGRVDLDVSGVTFMDTAGLELLDSLDDHGSRPPVRVTATGWTGQPRRVLELTGLDTTDPPHPSADTAGPERPRPPVTSAVALERTERLLQLQTEVEQLRRAISSRPVIDQARGVLMATHACTAEQAWNVLREASQRSNTKLHAVAASITAGARDDGPAPPGKIRSALRTALARHTGPGPDTPRPQTARSSTEQHVHGDGPATGVPDMRTSDQSRPQESPP
ncbi:ANTAR domain-containing response regulator [Streptomyces sp. NPDC006706]|uniref:ANTAR domain-containing response regulator n=1 Tax=Streptomyces sp. NPDC006706 TaxID=3364761 RepID=UPI0036BB0914